MGLARGSVVLEVLELTPVTFARALAGEGVEVLELAPVRMEELPRWRHEGARARIGL